MLRGERTIELQAPAEAAFGVLADVERYPEWQGFLSEVHARERDADGRAALADARADAKVTTLSLLLRCSYQPPHAVAWRTERGDVKALVGRYAIDDLGGGACSVTFHLEVDPGFKLGLLLRGGVADRIRDRVLEGALDGLRERVRAAGSSPSS